MTVEGISCRKHLSRLSTPIWRRSLRRRPARQRMSPGSCSSRVVSMRPAWLRRSAIRGSADSASRCWPTSWHPTDRSTSTRSSARITVRPRFGHGWCRPWPRSSSSTSCRWPAPSTSTTVKANRRSTSGRWLPTWATRRSRCREVSASGVTVMAGSRGRATSTTLRRSVSRRPPRWRSRRRPCRRTRWSTGPSTRVRPRSL